mgnify:FL=1
MTEVDLTEFSYVVFARHEGDDQTYPIALFVSEDDATAFVTNTTYEMGEWEYAVYEVKPYGN